MLPIIFRCNRHSVCSNICNAGSFTAAKTLWRFWGVGSKCAHRAAWKSLGAAPVLLIINFHTHGL
jgi:hypothetical protein